MSSNVPENTIQQGDILRLEISQKFASIQVVPNGNEGHDENFPRNLHNAAELFLRLGMVPQAVKLKETTDQTLELYQNDPVGVKLGRGCVCWNCGYCGIPRDYQDDDSKETPPGPCKECGNVGQINWLRVTQASGDDLPWIELSAMTEQQASELKLKQKVELAAKRAAVEARVTEALKQRTKPEETLS